MINVKFKKNDGSIGDEICELLETIGDCCRIKRPSGEIIRIYKDRVYDLNDESDDVKNDSGNNNENDKVMPGTLTKSDFISSLPEDSEIWIKFNSFNDTTICETIAVVIPSMNVYKSANVYNGVINKIMEYKLNSDTRKKLDKKGYEKT